MDVPLLHGMLHCTIFGAENLVHEQPSHHLLGAVTGIVDKVMDLIRGPNMLYATVDLGVARVGRTHMVSLEPVNPVWRESFQIYCAHYASEIVISIKDDDMVGSHVIGRARIPVQSLLSGAQVETTYDLYANNNNNNKALNPEVVGKVRVSLQFLCVQKDEENGWMLRHAFFAPRQACHVKLYQDAEMQPGFLPSIYLSDGQLYKGSRCWEDISDAISDAKIFIYIAGWSIYTEISLRRDGSTVSETLGELLKRKAEEGVSVAILVWDDRSSIEFIRPQGVMDTHDEDTIAFFRSSKVKCLLCPRIPDDSLSAVQVMQIATMFSHHQKLVSLDVACASPSGARKVVSFMGGIDLCNGRFDDQRHSLFRTLNAEHSRDFYQTCFLNSSLASGGPRQPWHDIHCQLQGPIAWDVVSNFEQRWKKQGRANVLADLVNNPHLLPSHAMADELHHDHTNPEAWNAQLFRSMDAGAAFGFPDNHREAAEMGLVSGKNNITERSIQDAYIQAIRSADRFIYIENQYFIGSCYAWETGQNVGCLNLIPMEITLKIVSKIEAGERFVAYIVIPMWPEGVPDSVTVQAILDWQRRTMEMMYKKIVFALRRSGRDESPSDYLCFFCLGNRETRHPEEVSLPPFTKKQDLSLHYRLAQESRRFMIYVHSKMMIVDDEYIIVGSANINQRSMDGGRDTELAMGAYQHSHTWKTRGASPRGQIHGFRLSLWYEHLGMLNNCFLEPWSLKCVRYVCKVSNHLWDLFAGSEVVDLPGHLLTYPVAITENGEVTAFPGLPYFPDTKASILGKEGPILSILTT